MVIIAAAHAALGPHTSHCTASLFALVACPRVESQSLLVLSTSSYATFDPDLSFIGVFKQASQTLVWGSHT